MKRAEIVADKLAISGYASLEGFLCIDSGAVVVLEVDTLPPLHQTSTFLAQAPFPTNISSRVLLNENMSHECKRQVEDIY